jgi:hypothetical protein
MAYTIDLDCMTAIQQAAGSAGTATGKSLSATGTEFTPFNGGSNDLQRAWHKRYFGFEGSD